MSEMEDVLRHGGGAPEPEQRPQRYEVHELTRLKMEPGEVLILNCPGHWTQEEVRSFWSDFARKLAMSVEDPPLVIALGGGVTLAAALLDDSVVAGIAAQVAPKVAPALAAELRKIEGATDYLQPRSGAGGLGFGPLPARGMPATSYEPPREERQPGYVPTDVDHFPRRDPAGAMDVQVLHGYRDEDGCPQVTQRRHLVVPTQFGLDGTYRLRCVWCPDEWEWTQEEMAELGIAEREPEEIQRDLMEQLTSGHKAPKERGL